MGHSENYRMLKRAIQERRRVVCIYDGRRRVLCPHILGMTNGQEKVKAYQVEVSGEAPPKRRQGQKPRRGRRKKIRDLAEEQWRCMTVADISQLAFSQGEWRSAKNYSPPKDTCVGQIDVAV